MMLRTGNERIVLFVGASEKVVRVSVDVSSWIGVGEGDAPSQSRKPTVL